MSRKTYNIRTLEDIRNNEKESLTKEKESQNYSIKKNKISEIIIKENIVTTQQKNIKKKTY
jgi:ribosomal protein L17